MYTRLKINVDVNGGINDSDIYDFVIISYANPKDLWTSMAAIC